MVKKCACNAGDPGSIPGWRRSTEEENHYPLQYSCLKNSMERGAWRDTVHGVTKSRTRLKQLSTFVSIKLYYITTLSDKVIYTQKLTSLPFTHLLSAPVRLPPALFPWKLQVEVSGNFHVGSFIIQHHQPLPPSSDGLLAHSQPLVPET